MKATPAQVWKCGSCEMYSHTQEQAEACCTPRPQPLCECGQSALHTGRCLGCFNAKRRADLMALPRANDHDGPVFAEGSGRFWASVDEWLDDQHNELPELQAEFVHPGPRKTLRDVSASALAEYVYEGICTREWCDDWEITELFNPDMAALEAFLRGWLDEAADDWWWSEPDTSRVIVLGEVEG